MGPQVRILLISGVDLAAQCSLETLKKNVVDCVADPEYLSRIRFFSSRIQGQKDYGSRIRIRIKELKYL